MRADEVVGWGDLAAEVVARGAGHVEEVHRAVVDRVAGLVDRGTGASAIPVRTMHDAIARTAYGSVTHGGRVLVRGAARVAGWAWPRRARRGPASAAGSVAQATVVGLIGDQLAEAGSPIAWPVRLRADGDDVDVAPRALAEAHPQATGRLLVFLPGLFETEHAWRFGAERWWDDEPPTLGDRARADGWTPLHVRYPSSQPLADNGRELAELLRRTTDLWPVEVAEVAIVGHSMGGLLARHAVHTADRDGHAWVRRCRHVVCLGTPHGGSPVARAAASAARTLAALPETRSIGEIVDLRSRGIRELELTDPVPDVPGVDVHVVAAVRGRGTGPVATEVVGDFLVGASSARGRAGDGSWLTAASHRTFWGLHHFDLLNHPEVDAHVRDLLGARGGRGGHVTRSAAPAGGGAPSPAKG